jgi:hypothetical protein
MIWSLKLKLIVKTVITLLEISAIIYSVVKTVITLLEISAIIYSVLNLRAVVICCFLLQWRVIDLLKVSYIGEFHLGDD